MWVSNFLPERLCMMDNAWPNCNVVEKERRGEGWLVCHPKNNFQQKGEKFQSCIFPQKMLLEIWPVFNQKSHFCGGTKCILSKKSFSRHFKWKQYLSDNSNNNKLTKKIEMLIGRKFKTNISLDGPFFITS